MLKFPCPHCKKGLSVKEHLAGKKATCPACKKPIVIPTASVPAPGAETKAAPDTAPATAPAPAPAPKPAPAPPTQADAEAAAAEAFADEPKAEEAAPQTITFNCPMCDESVTVPAADAGKRTSCPSCRRIVKVPELVKAQPKDWRKLNKLGARTSEMDEPEGGWGTQTSATGVSETALQEAGVIEDRKRPPLTRGQKITRGLLAGALVVALITAGFAGWSWYRAGRADKNLHQAIDYAASKEGADKLRPEGVAALHTSVAEYYLNQKTALKPSYVGADTPGSGKLAGDHLNKAYGALQNAPDTGDRDAVLYDLAVALVDLGGDKPVADTQVKLSWEDVQKRLLNTLALIKSPECRLLAVQAVSRKLIAVGQTQRVVPLASQVLSDPGPRAEVVATAGTELVLADQKAQAEAAYTQAVGPFVGETRPQGVSLTPAVVALAVALGKEPPKAAEGEKEATQIGQAWGEALAGREAAARDALGPIRNPLDRLVAMVHVADVAQKKASGESPELTNAIGQARGSPAGSGWWIVHLTALAAQAGQEEDALKSLAAVVPERDLRGRARLVAVRGWLAKNPKAKAEEGMLQGMDEGSLSQALARQALARHNKSLAVAQGWDEPSKSLGTIGALIGMQK